MPVEVAIGATAVVHLANNLYKVALMARHADRTITPVFAGFSVIGALAGAWLLTLLAGGHTLHTYALSGRSFNITVIGLVIGAMMIAFAVLELTPATSKWGLPRNLLWLGGILSGFFGGLSGHQGALRSAFLVRTEMSKDALVGTRAVCAVAVDTTRLVVYAVAALVTARAISPTDEALNTFRTLHEHNAWALIATGCVAALVGTTIGKRLLKEVTIDAVRITVAVALLILGAALAAGIV